MGGALVGGEEAEDLREPEPGGLQAAAPELLQREVEHLVRARSGGVPRRADRRLGRARSARPMGGVQRGDWLAGPLLDPAPHLGGLLLAPPGDRGPRWEMLLEGRQRAAHLAPV